MPHAMRIVRLAAAYATNTHTKQVIVAAINNAGFVFNILSASFKTRFLREIVFLFDLFY